MNNKKIFCIIILCFILFSTLTFVSADAASEAATAAGFFGATFLGAAFFAGAFLAGAFFSSFTAASAAALITERIVPSVGRITALYAALLPSKNAKAILEYLGFKVKLDGVGYVENQSIAPGEKIEKNTGAKLKYR